MYKRVDCRYIVKHNPTNQLLGKLWNFLTNTFYVTSNWFYTNWNLDGDL